MKKTHYSTVCYSTLQKTILCFLLLGTVTMAVTAQNKLSFTYDADGNRTERAILLTRSAASEPESPFQEEISRQTIKIYPNPTRGQLSIEVSDIKFDSASLVIYDVSGNRIIQSGITGTNTVLDISMYPAGVYILHITIDDEVSVWKIIKE